MIYKEFKGDRISRLGFGCMRFPLIEGSTDIDEVLTEKMVDYAIANGVNYFDTAAPYHDGNSEIVIGKILKKYPRDSFYLATKFPGHQIKPGLEGKVTQLDYVFEGQLKKCGVEYFDYYLLHNVCENSMDVYTDPQRGIIEYLVEQKKAGRIRHLGFSSHASYETLKDFVEKYGADMEFCMIQLNYLDWTLQNAKAKYEYLRDKGLGIWVMESARGGTLANLRPEIAERLKAARPDESVASWAFRWIQELPDINVALSGMSTYEQVLDNIKTYSEIKPLSDSEKHLIEDIAANFAKFVPCTACNYCLKECPQELNIPGIIKAYNDFQVQFSFTPLMYIEALGDGKRPSDCLACGACEAQCPQGIKISEVMRKCVETYESHPSWTRICQQRFEKANKKIES